MAPLANANTERDEPDPVLVSVVLGRVVGLVVFGVAQDKANKNACVSLDTEGKKAPYTVTL